MRRKGGRDHMGNLASKNEDHIEMGDKQGVKIWTGLN
jgi:hypothetical protein